MSFILILTVYGRFFKLYLYTAISPLPLSAFAGEGTSGVGKSFIKSYIGVCMEGAVIVLACLIYTAFLNSSAPAVDADLPAVTMAWKYIGQQQLNAEYAGAVAWAAAPLSFGRETGRTIFLYIR